MTEELQKPEPYTFASAEEEMAWLASLTEADYPAAVERQEVPLLLAAFARASARLLALGGLVESLQSENAELRAESDKFTELTISRTQEDHRRQGELEEALRQRDAAMKALNDLQSALVRQP